MGTFHPSIALLTPNPTTSSFVEFTAEGDASISNFQWSIPSNWSSSDLNSRDLITISGSTPGAYEISVTAESCDNIVSDFIEVTLSNFIRSKIDNASTRNGTSGKPSPIPQIYPNPAQESIFLEYLGSNQNVQASIMDLNRNVVEIHSIQKGVNNLDISELTAGVYFVSFNNPEMKPMRFIKI